MIGKISAKYAFRSLGRHPRRTVLSVLGVGIGCALGMIAVAYYGGAAEMQIRAACGSGTGHLRIVPSGWTETQRNSLRLTDWQTALATARETPHLKSAAIRARINGLLAFGNRTAGVEVLGVLPDVEREANRIVARSELEGRYLRPADRGGVVIGKALARRLDVELDDDLMVTLSGRDGIRSAMWRIVGILATGTREIDESICHVSLEELCGLSGFDAPGEITLLLHDHEFIELARRHLDGRLGQGNTVITWKQINRAVAANIEGDTAFINLMSAIVVLVVVLGITSAQLAAVLERRKEFAILTAVGLKARHLAGVLMLEALLTGVAGAGAAGLLGGPVAYWIATKGINIGKLFGGEFAMEGVLFDPIIYGDFGPWMIPYALGVSIAGTLTAMVYPAWFAVRTNPADALRTV